MTVKLHLSKISWGTKADFTVLYKKPIQNVKSPNSPFTALKIFLENAYHLDG